MADKDSSIAAYVGSMLARIFEVIGFIISGIISLIMVGAGLSIALWLLFGPTAEERERSRIKEKLEKKEELSDYDLKRFLEINPRSKYASEAERVRDELAWKLVVSAKPMVPDCTGQTAFSANRLYWEYLEKRPTGQFADKAKSLLDEACWDHAKASQVKGQRPHSYFAYLKLFPKGRFEGAAEGSVRSGLLDVATANRDKTVFEELRDRAADDQYYFEQAQKGISEIEAWDVAVKTDTYDGFREFLKAFPAGLFKDDVIDWMEYHGQWKPRPPTEKVDEALNQAGQDVERTPEFPYPSPENSAEKELIAKCKGDAEFTDLQYGASIVGSHYDDLRRHAVFGFLAPDRDRSRIEAIAFLKLLSSEQIAAIVQAAWRKINLSVAQRRALKALARVGLEHEHIFDKAFDRTAQDILEARWQWFNFGTGWYDIKAFPEPSKPCFGLPFVLPNDPSNAEGGYIFVGTDITTTFYDFWYRSTKDGTTQVFKDILAVVQSSE